jgi:6-phosphogluconate dehydrogenase
MADIGIIGLLVTGKNLFLNMNEHGFKAIANVIIAPHPMVLGSYIS